MTVFDLTGDIYESFTHFCALIPRSARKQVLSSDGWDLHIGSGRPSVWTSGGPKPKVSYDRLGLGNGIEPLIHYHEFHGVRPDYAELIEEFRLYHNLYYDEGRRVYLQFDEDGNEEEAAILEQQRARVKLHLLTGFLAVRQMELVIFLAGNHRSRFALGELGLEPGQRVNRGPKHRLNVELRGPSELSTDGHQSSSRLLGKIILPCPTRSVPDPFHPRRVASGAYPKFIIGNDAKGAPVRHICDPDRLADYFGKNPQAPHYLTPVYFRREVLQKYYDNPQRYEVEDGSVRCKGLWSMRLDNDRLDYVVVWLGDLGRDLSERERQHWLQYNVAPERGLSRTFSTRNLGAWFADPEVPDLVFRRRYGEVNDRWMKKHGWHLFLPLRAEDGHLLQTVRVPLNNNQAEFDGQVLVLTKLLVDSLNESELQRGLTTIASGDKGITKLEKFLVGKGMLGHEPHIQFLRNLQTLRAGSAHRKGGKDYPKAATFFGVDTREIKDVGADLLRTANEALGFFDAV